MQNFGQRIIEGFPAMTQTAPSENRPFLGYIIIIFIIIALGLPARTTTGLLPLWYICYVADALWAMMLFFIFGLIFRKYSTLRIFAVSVLFTWSIELSQFYHAPWIDYLRSIKIFALILGFDFLFSDLAAYTVGITAGTLIEKKLFQSNNQQKNS